MEYLNFSLGQPYNLVVVFHTNGFISEEELRKALEKVQKKHPLLRVRIKDDNKGNFWFTSEGVGAIPLEVTEFEDDVKINNLFLKHLETPFDLDDKSTPLFRAT
ncbi:MAG: condensation domain-containing protein, partial [Candidatus Heimdallarchaeaceae archaeon]